MEAERIWQEEEERLRREMEEEEARAEAERLHQVSVVVQEVHYTWAEVRRQKKMALKWSDDLPVTQAQKKENGRKLHVAAIHPKIFASENFQLLNFQLVLFSSLWPLDEK